MHDFECHILLQNGSKQKRIGLVGILLVLAFSGSASHAEQKLVINSSYSAPITSLKKDGFLDLLYQELSIRTCIKIEIQHLPAERALVNANEGIDDGDAARNTGMEKIYPNLVMVPEPVMRIQQVVFTRDENFKVNDAESLKHYDVGIVTGRKTLERMTVGTRSRVMVETPEQLFAMLDKKRIDVAIHERMQSLYLIKTMGIKNIKELQPAFLEVDWYLYLNKNHAALLPTLAAALKKMNADGTTQRLYDNVISRYK